MSDITKSGIVLTHGPNDKREPGRVHEELHAPCGCAFHERPAPHWHPCQTHNAESDAERLMLIADRIQQDFYSSVDACYSQNEVETLRALANRIEGHDAWLRRCLDWRQTDLRSREQAMTTKDQCPACGSHDKYDARGLLLPCVPPNPAPQPSGVEKDVLLPCPCCRLLAGPLTEPAYLGTTHFCAHCGCRWSEAHRRTVTVPVEVLRELADLRAEYARVRRVAQQIADGSGCANCRGIAIEFDTTVGKEP